MTLSRSAGNGGAVSEKFYDAMLNGVLAGIGGTAFGFWQHSFWAGVFAAIAIASVRAIAWAIEYRAA